MPIDNAFWDQALNTKIQGDLSLLKHYAEILTPDLSTEEKLQILEAMRYPFQSIGFAQTHFHHKKTNKGNTIITRALWNPDSVGCIPPVFTAILTAFSGFSDMAIGARQEETLVFRVFSLVDFFLKVLSPLLQRGKNAAVDESFALIMKIMQVSRTSVSEFMQLLLHPDAPTFLTFNEQVLLVQEMAKRVSLASATERSKSDINTNFLPTFLDSKFVVEATMASALSMLICALQKNRTINAVEAARHFAQFRHALSTEEVAQWIDTPFSEDATARVKEYVRVFLETHALVVKHVPTESGSQWFVDFETRHTWGAAWFGARTADLRGQYNTGIEDIKRQYRASSVVGRVVDAAIQEQLQALHAAKLVA